MPWKSPSDVSQEEGWDAMGVPFQKWSWGRVRGPEREELKQEEQQGGSAQVPGARPPGPFHAAPMALPLHVSTLQDVQPWGPQIKLATHS